MAGGKIWEYDKIYTRPKNAIGLVISDFIARNRKGGIPTEAIREIICDFVEAGNCKFFRVKFGKQEIIIDDVQYADLISMVNV